QRTPDSADPRCLRNRIDQRQLTSAVQPRFPVGHCPPQRLSFWPTIEGLPYRSPGWIRRGARVAAAVEHALASALPARFGQGVRSPCPPGLELVDLGAPASPEPLRGQAFTADPREHQVTLVHHVLQSQIIADFLQALQDLRGHGVLISTGVKLTLPHFAML